MHPLSQVYYRRYYTRGLAYMVVCGSRSDAMHNAMMSPEGDLMNVSPMALIPCRTKAEAQQLVKLHGTGAEEMVLKASWAMHQLPRRSTNGEYARAVLTALGLLSRTAK